MICAITARRVEPQAADEFMDAFMVDPERLPPMFREKFKAVYACEQSDDPGVILTFGIFDGTIEEFDALQSSQERDDQLERIDDFVEETLFSGTFEMARDYIAEAEGAAVGEIELVHS